ncbi:hypothetical protein KDX38_06195 [Pseudomonas sp. CDFA 602]|uniref:Tc toxin subunit A n=1 Tax=Pseudomonas californiensis TaxID=2829823 RepID=UPI001E4D690B|nr:Tc toxin subunit A [Pseudomonas californiensis]MCD5993407.1 hypothetical protein [Pseudomonas californiensis]MCD5998802.1 hypothetical protein [Pseudomonas californiensis]
MTEQPFSLLKTLAKAETDTSRSDNGKSSFVDAMTTMNIESVFDIVRRSKTAFVRELSTLSDANGDLAYDNARCYAMQIVRLYRNQLVSSGGTPLSATRTGVRSLVEIGPSFPKLFKENWDQFCKVGAIEAKDSPVAYLTSLYRFATTELESDPPNDNRITLDKRRPDLKELIIDQASTFTPIPTLQLVNEVLLSAIKAYIEADAVSNKDKTIYQLLAEKKHPFEFPYNRSHKQISLGLGGKNPTLGELNYLISLKVPATSGGTVAYGAMQQNSSNAQMMMSGLGPEQQSILLEPMLPEPTPPDAGVWSDEPALPADEVGNAQITAFFRENYGVPYAVGGTSNPLDSLQLFIEKTGLSGQAVEALLGVASAAPHHSANSSPTPSFYGTGYVNGNQSPALSLDKSTAGTTRLLNTSEDRFDRLQRMIRLQRWLDIPFAELDTLITASIWSQGTENTAFVITPSTVRALGTYRFLSQHYSLKPEEFAAFLHHISVYARPGQLPLNDQIFNSPTVFNTPFKLDRVSFYLGEYDVENERTLMQLCAALGLTRTQESLSQLATETLSVLKPITAQNALKRDLATISSLYRQARIASMFGLKPEEGRVLADLLGGQHYRELLITGMLRPYEELTSVQNSLPDILDVIMQMDWAVKWFTSTGRDVMTVRRQLAVDPVEYILTEELTRQVIELGLEAKEGLLIPQELNELKLPAGSPAIDWPGILQSLQDDQGLINDADFSPTEDIAQYFAEKILDAIGGSLGDPQKKEASVLLGDFVFKGYVAQRQLVEGLLQNIVRLPSDRCDTVMCWAGSSSSILLKHVISFSVSRSPQAISEQLAMLTRYTETTQQLGLSTEALRAFLVNPHWLSADFSNPLSLTLSSLYLLDRYQDWRDNSGFPEATLLGYFSQANASVIDDKTCAKLLAPLIGWSASEVQSASASLIDSNNAATSMEQVDWLRRLHSASMQTGLSASRLLNAAALNRLADATDWSYLGDAVMTASTTPSQ